MAQTRRGRPTPETPQQRLERRLQHAEWTLAIIASEVMNLVRQGEQEMALGQDILDMVTAEDTKVDSVIALLNGLVANNVIPQAVADAIKAKIQGSEDKLDAAISANTSPPPPPTP